MLGNYDRVVIARKPDGTPIHTTRATLREYGYEAVRAEAMRLTAAENNQQPKCPDCNGKGYLGNLENCRTCSPMPLNRCACGTNIPAHAMRCMRCTSERVPCSRCTSDIYCEMNGCQRPRAAGVAPTHGGQR